MKRYLYIMATIFFMVGCADDTLDTTAPAEYAEVSISAHTSSVFINDSAARNDSAASLDMTNYCVRYVIEAWSRGDNPELGYRGITTVASLDSELNHTFRIIEGNYDFLLWADYVSTDTTADNHYNTSTSAGLMSVTIADPNYAANDLSRDCFAALMEDVTIEDVYEDLGTVELARPLSMLVVKNDDAANVTDDYTVAITFGSSIPYGYNVLSGEVLSGDGYSIAPTYGTTTADEDIAFDYIFTAASTTYDITIDIASDDGADVAETITRTAYATPFVTNMKTNITSNFFSSSEN